AAETSNAAVLLAAERPRRSVVHACVVDMGHACLNSQSEAQAPTLITREHGTRQAVFGVICEAQCVIFAASSYDWRDRTEGFVLRNRLIVPNVGQHMRAEQYIPQVSTKSLLCR